MKVLIIKMTSMGDVIHTFPALTDAQKHIPDIQFDWVVEKAFQELPKWHVAVNKVIPVALRKWRKNPWQALKSKEISSALTSLRQEKYDLVIDAQGLLKSGILAGLTKGKRFGLDKHSIREPLATWFYKDKVTVAKGQHAVTRTRELFAKIFNYPIPQSFPDFAIEHAFTKVSEQDYLVFLHGTTWITKHWPETYWYNLIELINNAPYKIYLPWGNEVEHQRAKRLAQAATNAEVLPKLSLTKLGNIIANSKGIVAQDSGLAHLAAALAIPTISLYGPTDPALTGTVGHNQTHLAAKFSCAPCLQRSCTYQEPTEVQPACFATITPKFVWDSLQQQMEQVSST